MQIIDIIILLVNIVALSICGGLVYSVLILPKRDRINLLFASVSASMGLWIAMALLQRLIASVNVPDVLFGQIILNLLTTGIVFTILSYFLFLVRYVGIQNTAVDILKLTAGVSSVVALLIIWTNNAAVVKPANPSEFDVMSLGFILLGVALAYLIISFWLLINTRSEQADNLRLPTLLLFVTLIAASVDIWADNLGLDAILGSSMLFLVGRMVIQHQVVDPQEELNRDLRRTNQELQKSINDLAREKSRAENLNRELVEANRYKDQFLATMSHELRTPLNSIVGYSELLMTNIYGELDPRQADRLERINRNGKHLTGVIDAILDMNKIDSGRMQLHVSDFELPEVIQRLTDEIKSQLDPEVIELHVQLPSSLPQFRGDQQRIEQVMGIILDNALKFTTKGSVKVVANHATVKQGNSDNFQLPTIGWLKDGDWAIITISDTGVGIAPEDQARIFDRFSQVDSSRTREYEGVGLGLTIARKLVEMHDGIIWVKSYVGQGSTFYIALPIQTEKRPV